MAACVLLGACNSSPSQAPAAGATAQAPVAAADTLAADTLPSRPAPRATVPFVNPTKVGRVLGSQTPSPPASRTR
jgi:hypothetical protein